MSKKLYPDLDINDIIQDEDEAFMKGGPGSGIRGHKTYSPNEPGKRRQSERGEEFQAVSNTSESPDQSLNSAFKNRKVSMGPPTGKAGEFEVYTGHEKSTMIKVVGYSAMPNGAKKISSNFHPESASAIQKLGGALAGKVNVYEAGDHLYIQAGDDLPVKIKVKSDESKTSTAGEGDSSGGFKANESVWIKQDNGDSVKGTVVSSDGKMTKIKDSVFGMVHEIPNEQLSKKK